MKIKIELPEWANVRTHEVSIELDGKVLQSVSLKPGYHELEVPSAALRGNGVLAVDAQPAFSLPAPDGRKVTMRILAVWSGETRLSQSHTAER